MSHEISVDLTPSQFVGKQGITIEDNYFMLNFNRDEMSVNTSNPNEVKLDTLDVYELTSHIPSNIMMIRWQRKRKRMLDDIPIEEWQKRLELAPINIVTENLKKYYAILRIYWWWK